MMKRFNWKSFDFGPELELDSKLGIKYEKPNINREQSSNTEIKIRNSFNFYDEIAPKTIEDLAVHSKKIEDVQKWLILNVLNQETKNKFLLLSGPSGSAKTTTLKVLCKKLSISVLEWVNPTDKVDEPFKRTSQMKRFMEFLIDSKWNPLFETENSKKITFVKDFPNAVIYQPEEFFNVLNECYKLKYPIVFICTGANGNATNLLRTLFNEDIVNKFNIVHISFNACAPSLMKKAMKRAQFILQENFYLYREPLPSTIDVILSTAMGDIRNALNQLCLKYLDADAKDVKNKRKSQSETSFRNVSKDEKLGLFHGLGRILNPKRKQLGNSWRLNCDIEKLVDEFLTQPTLFITFLFENYLKYFGSIGDASNAAEILSISLNFLNNWVDKQDATVFGLWISILGLMVYNEHKISKWNQIRGPNKVCNFYNNSTESMRLKPMDNFYSNIIKNFSTYHIFENLI